MKNISVSIDFIDMCYKSVEFAFEISNGAHGKSWFKNNLLDSNILKRVQLLKVAPLAIQDYSIFPKGGFDKILFIVVANLDFEQKAKTVSVGYARQNLKFVESKKMSVISILSNLAKVNTYYSMVHQENILLNKSGIPVFCANDLT